MLHHLTGRRARLGMAIASLVGLFASIYLLYTYLTGGPIACAIVSGCEIVRASKWANVFGVIPRPALGVLFYIILFQFLEIRAGLAYRPKLMLQATQLLALIGFIESGILFVIQWVDLKAFCLWCLISGLSATIIFILSFFDRAHEGDAGERKKELKEYFSLLIGFVPIAVILFVGLIYAADYQPRNSTSSTSSVMTASPRSQK